MCLPIATQASISIEIASLPGSFHAASLNNFFDTLRAGEGSLVPNQNTTYLLAQWPNCETDPYNTMLAATPPSN